MNTTEQTILTFLQERINDLEAVYLFGSVAAANDTGMSDIDIAFLSQGRTDPLDRFETAEAIASALGRDVDLVDLSTASEVMRFEIVSKGRRLFAADANAAGMFEDQAYMLYIDLNENRAAILKDIAKRGSVY